MSESDVIKVAESFVTWDQLYALVATAIDPTEHLSCALDSDGIWKRIELKWMTEYFEENEEYEKCGVLKTISEAFLIVNDEEQINLNEAFKKILDEE